MGLGFKGFTLGGGQGKGGHVLMIEHAASN